MRIAVISEISTVQRNGALIGALSNRGHEICNVGMKNADDPELNYLHTGLMAALALTCGAAKLVVGGCGTGQGFLLSAMQYPSVRCGLIIEPVDALLFSRINGGNCLSLPLNKGYGWAGEIVLSQVFDAWFSSVPGEGYPAARAVPQSESRLRLGAVDAAAHRPWDEIIPALPPDIIKTALDFPGFLPFLKDGKSYHTLSEALRSIR